MFTEPTENNCFIIIFEGEYQEPQKRAKTRNHTRDYSFVYSYAAVVFIHCEWIYTLSQEYTILTFL